MQQEHKDKIRLAHLGKKLTKEHKLKISKGNKGLKRTEDFKIKTSINKTGSLNPNWNGGSAHYRSVHMTLKKRYGKPLFCENRENRLFPFFCSEKCNIFDWAKKSDSKYTALREDYYQLCRSCHKKYDLTYATDNK